MTIDPTHPPQDGYVAKRGDIVLVEETRTWLSNAHTGVKSGQAQRYRLGMVTSTSKGEVMAVQFGASETPVVIKGARANRHPFRRKFRYPFTWVWYVTAGKTATPELHNLLGATWHSLDIGGDGLVQSIRRELLAAMGAVTP